MWGQFTWSPACPGHLNEDLSSMKFYQKHISEMQERVTIYNFLSNSMFQSFCQHITLAFLPSFLPSLPPSIGESLLK